MSQADKIMTSIGTSNFVLANMFEYAKGLEVAKDEMQERCAKVCESWGMVGKTSHDCATAIRAPDKLG